MACRSPCLPTEDHLQSLVQQQHLFKQELSYRKEIAHKLHTQYIEGINSNPVTLKSTLRVGQGH